MKRLDCKGMSCPQPVLSTKDFIEEHPQELIEVIVDNKASRENVCRFLKSQGWSVSVKEKQEGVFIITAAPPTCQITHDEDKESREYGGKQKILILIPTDVFGQGSEELGRGLMKNFISTLKEMGNELWRIVLVNSGVRLSCQDSPVIEGLKKLENAGVNILVCGTCLEYYDLLDEKAVGQTTNMLDIVTSIQIASKVIRI